MIHISAELSVSTVYSMIRLLYAKTLTRGLVLRSYVGAGSVHLLWNTPYGYGHGYPYPYPVCTIHTYVPSLGPSLYMYIHMYSVCLFSIGPVVEQPKFVCIICTGSNDKPQSFIILYKYTVSVHFTRAYHSWPGAMMGRNKD